MLPWVCWATLGRLVNLSESQLTHLSGRGGEARGRPYRGPGAGCWVTPAEPRDSQQLAYNHTA